ncbi:prepilin-type N-terminal cleavage/methylation domain-containing protein [Clostridium sp.]|jgi:prepilin-type N-terminal cleavage/methylation domain-containing protein|uniref:prepilin-type N-terminal cleavage/methylation domain-containing protein n=1 Tax=Clostridium sp. TaxID=1506 RepID=UPI002584CD61|nr:prepilin-type N-terminal cleavage/methylation domain-containing protein [Clostridium sp.]MDF2502999.1 prepilin-type N-terminal cleavage/methylation protein [Clostridium sp.]
MKKGFTLIEVIAAIAIFSIAILSISMAFSTSLNISQMNDIKQDTSQYAQAITENYKALGYNAIDNKYKSTDNTTLSDFKYFNNLNDIQNWFYGGGMPSISGNVDNNAYPVLQGAKFGVLINISKTNLGDSSSIPTYHIYARIWRLDKGSQSQSVRDIYEGSD